MLDSSNRVAALLDGCPDPGGVLYPPAPPPPLPPYRPPVPKVTHLVLPAAGLCVRELAALLGFSFIALQYERFALRMSDSPYVPLGTSNLLSVPLDFAAASRLCAHLGVSVTSAA